MRPCTAIIALVLLVVALPVAAEDLYVPAAAHVSGAAGTEWRTDLEVKARGSAPATFRVELLEAESDNSNPHGAVFDVAAGESLRLEDLLEEVFGFTGSGALRVTASDGDILVTSRTYNDDPTGTYGQYIPALPTSLAAGSEVDVALIQLSRSADPEAGYRTNVGFVNVTGAALGLEVDLFTAPGALLGSGSYELLPWEYRQINDIFAQATSEDVSDGYVLVRTTTEGGLFFAYASVVDNRSGDAIFIPGQEDVPHQVEPAPRFAVFEFFGRHGGAFCSAGGAAVDDLALDYQGQPVVFLEYNYDAPLGDRLSRWWAANTGTGNLFLPFVMVDSGNEISNGEEDFEAVYGGMVDRAMARPPTAELEVERELVGSSFHFEVSLTNRASDPLGSYNDATLHAIVYEEAQVGDTSRYVRAATSVQIPDLAPDQATTLSMDVQVAGVEDWERVHTVVLADYRPAAIVGPYDMLQAVHQE